MKTLRVAFIIGMAPAEIQAIIFQQWVGEGVPDVLEKEWKVIRDKNMALVANRVTMATPQPMDIGEVGGEGGDSRCGSEEEGWDVDDVGKGDGKCRRCGGKGHFARECPTPAGKGIEGAKSAGNGFKGGGKAQWTGQWQSNSLGKRKQYQQQGRQTQAEDKKGIGKGYQGTCYKCGKVGHKAAECRSVQAVEGEEEGNMIGGVWFVGGVTAETDELSDAQRTNVVNKKKKMAKGSQLQEITINQVKAKGWESWGTSEVTIDSAPEESVCPRLWGDMFELDEVLPGNEMKLRNANSCKIAHYGQRDIMFEVEGDESMLMGMGFQASDVRKPLAAVHRIVEKGNNVQFGPGDEDNFIMNVKTGKKIMLRKKGRSYIMDVELAIQARATPFQRQP